MMASTILNILLCAIRLINAFIGIRTKICCYILCRKEMLRGVGSSEYTDITENKSEDYVILKTEGSTAYIALPFISSIRTWIIRSMMIIPPE